MNENLEPLAHEKYALIQAEEYGENAEAAEHGQYAGARLAEEFARQHDGMTIDLAAEIEKYTGWDNQAATEAIEFFRNAEQPNQPDTLHTVGLITARQREQLLQAQEEVRKAEELAQTAHAAYNEILNTSRNLESWWSTYMTERHETFYRAVEYLARQRLVEQFGENYESVLDEMYEAEWQKRRAEWEAKCANLSPEERAAMIPPGLDPDDWAKLSPEAQEALAAI